MNSEIVIKWLDSDSAFFRVRAARNLAKNVDRDKLDKIKQAFHTEQVPWVKQALKKTLDIYEDNIERKRNLNESKEDDEISEIVDTVQRDTYDESIGQMLHEIEPIIGTLKVQLNEELPDYPNSMSKVEIDRLDDLLEAFRNWRRIERSPKFKELVLKQIIESELSHFQLNNISVSIHGDNSLTIKTEPSLISIVLSNILRNSIEALAQMDDRHEGEIILSFGKKRDNYWLSIVDNGPGLQDLGGFLLKSRISTKPGHTGFGLSLVQRAATVLGADWKIENSVKGGVEFYFESPIDLSV